MKMNNTKRAKQPHDTANSTVTDEQMTTTTSPETEERIRERAYHCWEEAGCPVGDGVEFWLKAEAEIAQRPGASGSSSAS